MVGDLDREYAIWVNRDELGKKKEIHIEGSAVTFLVPAHIDGHVVLRLKGLGYRSGSRRGNLLVRINLMEEARGNEWSPFRRSRKGTEDFMGPFSQRQRPESRERAGGWRNPVTQNEVVEDPMQIRRGGYLIAGAGLVLLSGGFLGILPVSAWAGGIIVVAGIILAFFA